MCDITPVSGSVMCLGMDIVHFLYPFISDGSFGCFCFQGCYELRYHKHNALGWPCVSSSLGYLPRNTIADSCGNFVVNFLRNYQMVLKNGHPIFAFPIAICKGSNLTTALPTYYYYLSFLWQILLTAQ